ncbi:CBS domain-containing protein [Sphaerothrix gracilis]|uniref:CBS domain-containing protein n=1 Tax=Sphaerothrix gracilis TaxID=3151835 RepID=UPI0031FC04F6
MHLVLCHTTADFDTLGAAVGLSRLQAGTRIVLTGGCHPTVQNFLALHRDEYPLIERRAVDPDKIQALTLVDAQQRQRFSPVQDWLDLAEQRQLEITIYDHHLESEADIAAHHYLIEPVGATTTLIVEMLQQRGLQPSLAEATVMALGIHVDTGSLTYEQATARDARALAWLMEQGASMRSISEFVEPGLAPQLQDLLPQALSQLQTAIMQGYQLAWVLLPLAAYLPGLSGLASRLMSITNSDVLLLGAHYELKDPGTSKLMVIGRSRDRRLDEGINLAQLLEPLGGGGHATAAAATTRSPDPAQTFNQLVEQLKHQVPQPPTARELMSSPVRTIRPQTTIAEAQRILLRYGHSGLSVVNAEGNLVGIISRRDIDLALHHGFSHAPVKGYMSTRLKTITPETPLPEIESLMVTYDVGRLPVLAENQLLGIVTRTDVLRQRQQKQMEGALNSPSEATDSSATTAKTVQQQLSQRLPVRLREILQLMAKAAAERGWHLYVVGGVVRDFFLSKADTLELQDVDLVVDGFYQTAQAGAGVELAQLVQQRYPASELQVYGRFQTAALIWHGETDTPLMIDIATARTEFYPYPAANPEVEASSIRQDLYRRDFTINAMAIRLTPPQPGMLLDFFGGLIDLKQQQVRVLHANSFIEDPTRIYRAVRFAVRLQFRIEAQTEDYIHYALSSGIYSKMQEQVAKVPALQTRLKRELQYILEAPYWQPALGLLNKLGALKCLHSSLEMSDRLWHQLRRVSRWLERFQFQTAIAPWQLRLEVLIAQLEPRFRHSVATNLQLPNESIDRLTQLEAVEAKLQQTLSSGQQPSQVVWQLRSFDLPLLLLVSARQPRPIGQKIWQYLTRWSQVKAPIDGNDLKALGYQPGPQFKQMLDDVLAATLDRQIENRSEAIAFVMQRYALPQDAS